MWFYADNKSKPMSPTMTPKALLNKTSPVRGRRTPSRRTPIRRPMSPRPGSPAVRLPIVLPRPGSPAVRPGSPSIRPPIVIRPGSPAVRPPIVVLPRPGSPAVRPGSPAIRPPIVIKPGSPSTRRPILPRPGKPISPVQVIPGKPTSPTMFPGCPSGGLVSVPHVKYTLHQKPVVFEKVSKCVSQNQVPVTYEYEKKQHPLKVVKSPCGPCGRGRKSMSPSFGHGGHIKAMSPGFGHGGRKSMSPGFGHGGRKSMSPGGNIKLPCAMQYDSHLNRAPCKNVNALGKDFWDPALKEVNMFKGDGHRGHHGKKWWMGENAATSCGVKTPCGTNNFPRWQSQYVPQGKSPCMVATMGNCQRKRCGN